MNHGSVILNCGEVQEIVAGSSARGSAQEQFSTQPRSVARLRSDLAISPSRPPTDSAHLSESSTSSTHSIDGVLIVSPRNTPSISLPFAVSRKSFGSGQGGEWLSSRSTARGDIASTPCPPSPPNDFCQDHVATSSLSHGSRIAKTAEVASQIVKPRRSSAIQSPFGTRTPEVVPFHGKTTSRAGSTRERSGS